MYSKLKKIKSSFILIAVLGIIGAIGCFVTSFLVENISLLPNFHQDLLMSMLIGPLSNSKLLLIIGILDILISIFLFIFANKSYNLQNLQNKIKTNPNFKEIEVNQDFNSATNLGRVWIGNKFTVLLASKNSDIYINKNLAWAFVLKSGIFYYLFIMDFDNNKNITLTHPAHKPKILALLKEKCPNACVGYSEELKNIAFDNIENVKNFDKSNLDPYYSPIFSNYKDFIN